MDEKRWAGSNPILPGNSSSLIDFTDQSRADKHTSRYCDILEVLVQDGALCACVTVVGSSELGKLMTAHSAISSQSVAIRSLRIQGTRDWLENLAVDIAVASVAAHPNIVRLEAVRTLEHGEIQIATDLSDYRLIELVWAGRRLDYLQVAVVAVQLLDCVDFLGRCGIAHCGIRLENVLIRGEGEVQVCGFQYAQDLSHCPSSPFCENIHTPPEFLTAEHLSKKTDVWGIGVVVLELLLCKDLSELVQPHHGGEFQCKILAALAEKVADPAARSLVKGLLAQDPTQRLTPREAISHPFFQPLGTDWRSEMTETCDLGRVVSYLRAASTSDLLDFLQLQSTNALSIRS